jgi:hypothetical protein
MVLSQPKLLEAGYNFLMVVDIRGNSCTSLMVITSSHGDVRLRLN